MVNFRYVKMPRNFSYVTQDIFGSSLPKTQEQLLVWRNQLKVTDVITVRENPLTEKIKLSEGIDFHHWQVDGMTPPSKTQMVEMMSTIDDILLRRCILKN